MRFRFIEDRHSEYPVTIVCSVLDVSPAGYYAWRARPESRRPVANRALLDDIKQVHRDNHGCYGSPRIHRELEARGRGTSRGRIERLMRRHGIRAIMARPQLSSKIQSCFSVGRCIWPSPGGYANLTPSPPTGISELIHRA